MNLLNLLTLLPSYRPVPFPRFVRFPLKSCADLFGLPYTGVINRPDLQETLIDECVKLKPDFIRNGNPVRVVCGPFCGKPLFP